MRPRRSNVVSRFAALAAGFAACRSAEAPPSALVGADAPSRPASISTVEPEGGAILPTTRATGGEVAAARDPRWAAPLSRQGLPNLHRVSEVLYRGAQPELEGFAELRALGIRTIVNLRSAHSDLGLIYASGVPPGTFHYVEIPMSAWSVDEQDLVAFVDIAADASRAPLFVHCQHGADRTGAAVASYRMAVEGWSPAEAVAEMTEGGYGFHPIWGNLTSLLRRLDVPRLRRAAGIPAPGEAERPVPSAPSPSAAPAAARRP
jgi:protein tyrosine phosphatase (PTP) superfamily phosphohydrolase (DUF442 family)